MFLVRLQMASFRPFIPSVNENQSFLQTRSLFDVLRRSGKPFVVGLWRGIRPNAGASSAPRRVVPGRYYARVNLVGSGVIGQLLKSYLSQFDIIINITGKCSLSFWYPGGDWRGWKMGRKLNSGIKPVGGRSRLVMETSNH